MTDFAGDMREAAERCGVWLSGFFDAVKFLAALSSGWRSSTSIGQAGAVRGHLGSMQSRVSTEAGSRQ